MSYLIPSITKEQVEGANAKAGLKVFPFCSSRWVQHCAEVVGIEIQHGPHCDFLVVKGRNGSYGVRISVSLNPEIIVHDNGQSREKRIERNTERLLAVLSAFDLAEFVEGGVWLHPERFDRAIGTVFSFAIKGTMDCNGQQRYTDHGRAKTYVAFRGLAPELLPVVVPPDAASEKPVATCALNSSNVLASFDEEVA